MYFRVQWFLLAAKTKNEYLWHVLKDGFAFLSHLVPALKDGKYCVGFFLYLQKAFKVCNHKILLRKLEKHGAVGAEHEGFHSYLSGRAQVVHINYLQTTIQP